MANKDTSKTWFETGDFPTQAQFAQVFEWVRWKDEKVVVGDLDTALTALINTLAMLLPVAVVISGATGVYNVPAGYAVHRMYAQISTGSSTIKAGDTVGADDVFGLIDLNSGVTVAIDVTVLGNSVRPVYFTVDTLDETTQVYLKIYLHKIS